MAREERAEAALKAGDEECRANQVELDQAHALYQEMREPFEAAVVLESDLSNGAEELGEPRRILSIERDSLLQQGTSPGLALRIGDRGLSFATRHRSGLTTLHGR